MRPLSCGKIDSKSGITDGWHSDSDPESLTCTSLSYAQVLVRLASWKEGILPGNVQNIALASSEAICLCPSVTERFSPLFRRGIGCVTRAGKSRHIWTACGNIRENDSSISGFLRHLLRPADRLLHQPSSWVPGCDTKLIHQLSSATEF